MSSLDGRAFQLAEVLLVVLNVVDAAFTHVWLANGMATEANPLLAAAWETHPVTFHGLKAGLLFSGMAILHHLRWIAAARTAMGTLAAAYGGVVAWHLANL